MTSICIDGFNLAMPKGSGIATYGRNLLEAVEGVGIDRQILYGPAAGRKSSNVLNEVLLVDARPPLQDNRRRRVLRFQETLLSRFGRTAYSIAPTGEVIWPSGSLPSASHFWAARDLFVRANRCFHRYGKLTPLAFEATADVAAPDLMHWTAPLPIYAAKRPNIYTFHDLIPLRLPHTTLGDKARYMEMSLKVASRADHIVVVSEATRQDVIRLLGVDERRVTNTYQSVRMPPAMTSHDQSAAASEIEGVFGLGWKDYFLHFGAVEPKKNLGRIVEAYLSSRVKTPLILIGGRAWLDEQEIGMLQQVKRDGGPNADRIRQYDYMSFAMLNSLIRGAKGVLFPSLYEGFGLPVLEAMALSTAVLTSTGGALPEVAGDAALIVDPYDVQSISRAIKALDNDETLRMDLEVRGRCQAARFSPEAYQSRLLKAYSAVGVRPSASYG